MMEYNFCKYFGTYNFPSVINGYFYYIYFENISEKKMCVLYLYYIKIKLS